MARRFALALALAGCAAPSADPADGIDDAFLPGGKADSLVSFVEARGILELANTADLETLDDGVGLDRRAAEHMIAHRDGPDGAPGGGDDDRFDSLAELDGVAWVGPRAFARLRDYAIANGYIPSDGSDCLIISEYIEGWGNYNKAIELFNCGAEPVSLDRYALCLVRDDAADCTLTGDLGTAALAPGAVTTVCRRRDYHPASIDPIPALAEACALERPGLMTFSGDDRLLVVREDGSVADALGRVGYRPPPDTWADVNLERCDLAAADGVSFYDHRDYFREHTRGRFEGFGAPPLPGCP